MTIRTIVTALKYSKDLRYIHFHPIQIEYHGTKLSLQRGLPG
jgi:hypothetical protein